MQVLAPFLGMGIIIVIAGLIVWKTPLLKMIAGPTSKRNYDGLAEWTGKHAILIGVLVCAASVLSYLITGAPNGLVNLVIILFLGFKMSRGMNRF